MNLNLRLVRGRQFRLDQKHPLIRQVALFDQIFADGFRAFLSQGSQIRILHRHGRKELLPQFVGRQHPLHAFSSGKIFPLHRLLAQLLRIEVTEQFELPRGRGHGFQVLRASVREPPLDFGGDLLQGKGLSILRWVSNSRDIHS